MLTLSSAHAAMLTRAIARAVLALALVALLAATGCAATPPPPPATAAAAPTAAAPASNTPPWPQELDHPSTPETHRGAVDGLFEVIHMKSALGAAIDVTVRTQIDADPKLRPFESVMRRFMTKYLGLEGVGEPLAHLYMDRFSELEILQLTAFYRTPLGQRCIDEIPKLLEEGSRIGARKVQAHMDELKEMGRQQLQAP